jgi:trehalose-6-phosphate synthase
MMRSYRQGGGVMGMSMFGSQGQGQSERGFASSGHGQGGVYIDYAEVSSYKGISKSERLALYQAADLFLLTPIREGLNLLPLEYIYSRKDLARAGAVIVSEFSTCSSLLNGSLKVNPFSPVSIADAIEKALSMSNKECEYRRQRDMPFIQSHPSSLWTKQILNELEQLNSKIGHGRVLVSKFAEPLNQTVMLKAYQHAAR